MNQLWANSPLSAGPGHAGTTTSVSPFGLMTRGVVENLVAVNDLYLCVKLGGCRQKVRSSLRSQGRFKAL